MNFPYQDYLKERDRLYTQGGPAFPWEYDGDCWTGMSLRDWFAGMVMQGMVGAATERGDKMWDEKLAAKYAYDAANAMLAERAKTNS